MLVGRLSSSEKKNHVFAVAAEGITGICSSSSSSRAVPASPPSCCKMDFKNRCAILRGFSRVISALIMVWTSWLVGIKIVWLHTENTGQKEHVVVGNPNLAGLDFTDFSSRSIVHPGELQVDRQLVMRPAPPAAPSS